MLFKEYIHCTCFYVRGVKVSYSHNLMIIYNIFFRFTQTETNMKHIRLGNSRKSKYVHVDTNNRKIVKKEKERKITDPK